MNHDEQYRANKEELFKGAPQQLQLQQPQQIQPELNPNELANTVLAAVLANPEFRNLFDQSTGTAVGVGELKEGQGDIKDKQEQLITAAEDIKERTKSINDSIKNIQMESRTAMQKCLNAKSNKDIMECIIAFTKAFIETFGQMIRLSYLVFKYITASIDEIVGVWPYVGELFSLIIRGVLWVHLVYYIYAILHIIPGVNEETLTNTSKLLYQGLRTLTINLIDNASTTTKNSGPFKLLSHLYTETGIKADTEALAKGATVSATNAFKDATSAVTDAITPYWMKGGDGNDDSKIDEEIDTSKIFNKSGRSKELVNEITMLGNLISSMTKYCMSIIEIIVDIKLKSIKSGEPISDDVAREMISMLQFEIPVVIIDTYAESGIEQLLTLNNRKQLPSWVPNINQNIRGGMKKSKIKDKRSKSKKRLKSKKHTKSKRKTKKKIKNVHIKDVKK